MTEAQWFLTHNDTVCVRLHWYTVNMVTISSVRPMSHW